MSIFKNTHLSLSSFLLFGIICLWISSQIQAQNTGDFLSRESKENVIRKNILQIATLLGTDIGGGVPYGHIPKDFRPYPQLNISVGLWFNYIFNPNWQLGFTTTYKKVALAADARMENEFFRAYLNGSTELTEVYYTGIARQSMSFTMLEFPLVCKYGLGREGRYRIVFGAYGAWIMDKSFLVHAKTGYQGLTPDNISTIIPESGLELDFGYALHNWEAGLVLGYEQAITTRLNIDFMIYSGFKDIVQPSKKFLNYSMFPMRLGIHLSYSLLEFSPDKEDKFKFIYR
ncbi:MAG: outer membrane beta-barrel protein [Chitinophagaceae bacterium]